MVETETRPAAITIQVVEQQPVKRAPHERDIYWMFRFAGLPPKNHVIPTIAVLSTGVGAFSLLWNPNYYIFQPVFWSVHTMILIPAFLYLWRNRQTLYTVVGIPVSKAHRWITMAFYGLFMAYWAYFCWVAMMEHRADPWPLQIGHAFMGYVWYIFFSVSSAVYYYTVTLLFQRSAVIKDRVHALTQATTKQAFFTIYETEYETNRRIANTWNLILLLVILVLTLNIPADLLGILVNGKYVVIPGLIIKSAGLIWYLLGICKLNYMETYILNYLHKHHLLQDEHEEIIRYMEVRRLGLNFFGLRITYELIMKVAMLGLNVALPVLYGLFSEQILKLNFVLAKNETLTV